VHRRARLVGTQPKWRVRDPCHDEPSGWRKSNRDPRGLLAQVPRSHVHGRSLLRPFQASADTFKNTTEERCSGATKHTVSDKAAQLHPAPSSSRGASLDITVPDAEEGAKGSKKRHKQRR
jgi:hypothetical protein